MPSNPLGHTPFIVIFLKDKVLFILFTLKLKIGIRIGMFTLGKCLFYYNYL